MLAKLKHDHKHISILLNLLKKKCTKLTKGEVVNYNIIRDVLEYMKSYAEHSHHPLEETIEEYYREIKSTQHFDEQLSQEHVKLTQASSSLMATLDLILSDIVVSKEQLIDDLENYVQLQQAHMDYEEKKVFPHWVSAFSEDDWQKVECLCQSKTVNDPLFSDDDNVIFEGLKEYLAIE